MKNQQRFYVLVLGLCGLLPAAIPVAGWESAYGPPASRERAQRRVSPVKSCPPFGAGYVAIGTLDETGADPDVYVVFTDLAGAPYWERRYDVQGLGLADEGAALAVLPDSAGFVLLSNAQDGAFSPTLTQINCKGGVTWSRIYRDALDGGDLRGRDLIRTTNGDLAVAGLWSSGAADDAFLMRTSAAGALLWSSTYDNGVAEAFHALAEATAASGQPTGDLVAVGRLRRATGDLQGLVARVAGNGGAAGPAPRCFTHHGTSSTDEVYESVARLANGNFAGQFALAGTTSGTSWQDDVWLTRGNPCAPAVQVRIGGASSSEAGYDLHEVLATPTAPTGRLALAGSFAAAAGGPRDGTFLEVSTTTLLPIAGRGRLFGDHAGLDEVFYSLAENPLLFGFQPGTILAGFTEGAWETPADPRDLYLVRHDAGSRCALPWEPASASASFPRSDLLSLRRSPAQSAAVQTSSEILSSSFPVCP